MAKLAGEASRQFTETEVPPPSYNEAVHTSVVNKPHDEIPTHRTVDKKQDQHSAMRDDATLTGDSTMTRVSAKSLLRAPRNARRGAVKHVRKAIRTVVSMPCCVVGTALHVAGSAVHAAASAISGAGDSVVGHLEDERRVSDKPNGTRT